MANTYYNADSAKLPDLLSKNDPGRALRAGQARAKAWASGVAPSERSARLPLLLRTFIIRS